MELSDFLRVLRRRWPVIVLVLLLGTGGAAAASLTQEPRYAASTRLLVSGVGSGDAVDEMARRQLANQRAVAYAQLVGTAPAVQAAEAATGATGAEVTAAADGASPFVTINVTAGSPAAARDVANAYVDVLPDVLTRLEDSTEGPKPEISTLEAAQLPSAPSSPNPPRDLAIGAVAGLLLGLALAFVAESLSGRVRESSELAALTGATLLGAVPRERRAEPLPALRRPRSPRAEAYRGVRANLEFAGPEGMPRSIVVTSAAPGEGKSSLAANLAVVAARAGRTVVVVDADLRKPAVTEYFGVRAGAGLSDVLTGARTLDDVLVAVPDEKIHLLPSGPVPDYPSELVGSSTMAALIEELEARFDVVVVDTPPLLPVSDALLLGVHVGGVVLVARMGETRRAALRRSMDALERVNAVLLGVVGNATVRSEERAHGGSQTYYGYHSDAVAREAAPPSVRSATRRPPAPRPAAEERGPDRLTGAGLPRRRRA